MILLRTWDGIRSHFPARVAEWIMVYPSLMMGLAFQLQPDMFDLSPSFAQLQSWADEATWGAVCLVVGVVRLVALTVNGTFAAFRYAPHLRGLAAFVGGLFWGQFCLGLLVTVVDGQGALSGVVIYSTAVILELANLYRASSDIGAWARTRTRGGK